MEQHYSSFIEPVAYSIPPVIPNTTCNFCKKRYTTEAQLKTHECKIKPFILAGLNPNGTPNPDNVRFTDTQKDNLIRKLLLEVAILHKKVAKHDQELKQLKRKHMMQIVRSLNNDPSQVPSKTLNQWIAQLSVSISNVALIFQKNLHEAIKQVIYDGLNMSSNSNIKIPIQCFYEKANTLYIYGEESSGIVKWYSGDTSTIRKLCSSIATRFLQIYVENEEYFIDPSLDPDEKQDKKIQNLNKVMDHYYTNSNFLQELIAKLYDKLKERFPYADSTTTQESDED